MDVFDQHVYADNSSLPPSMPHTASTTIAEGDYTKLVALLGAAFDGTAQRGSNLPIVYGEFGVETTIPSAKAGAYSGVEPPTSGAVDEATQARYYAEAFKLALCQPNVIGINVFHVVDESALTAWQSGPFYADGTPKSSLERDSRGGRRRAERHAYELPRPQARRRSRSRARQPTAPCRASPRTTSASARSSSSRTASSSA